MSEKFYQVYKLTSSTTGLSYIGCTCQTLASRFGRNGRHYLMHSNGQPYTTKFANAIRALGWSDFHCSVLERCSEAEKDQREQFWISYYDTVNNGYNSEWGGNKGKIQSEMSKLKRSKTLEGHIVSKATRDKLSQNRRHKTYEQLIKNKEYFKNIKKGKISEEKRQKMPQNNHRNHMVECIDLQDSVTTYYRSIRSLCNEHEDWVYTTVVDAIKYSKIYKNRYIIRSVEGEKDESTS